MLYTHDGIKFNSGGVRKDI